MNLSYSVSHSLSTPRMSLGLYAPVLCSCDLKTAKVQDRDEPDLMSESSRGSRRKVGGVVMCVPGLV